ncbi:hypothetical protein [Neobacillus sp. PS3-40]|uniref:hypothetical protein n=1 Tax=Neobacillus sp. PS3-40 TaxID=3070679 RepID=UPI0027DEF556|nr:hypothetical protein [Neobacillus sp. PS3-40]WML44095.1 hypothetical protein RCG20_20315 [Neobacillus sp. PS3-40]
MKIGDKITFILLPDLGLIEAGDTIEETMDRINRAEVKQEIEDKKIRKKLEKANPGCRVLKMGDGWLISNKAPLD